MKPMTAFLRQVILTLIILSPAITAVHAEERVDSFDSIVEIHRDGSLTVTEDITVRAEGGIIRRGIWREFPTRYRTGAGSHVTVPFDVQDVRRDGSPEPWHTESRDGVTRVYIGRTDRLLEPGTYSYRLTYRTKRQIGYFEDYDELYWNVTGNDWELPIAAVTAVLRLPGGAPAGRRAAYTGRRGEKGEDFRSEVNADGEVIFSATRKLLSREGLTVAVSWPKGFVDEPGSEEKAAWFIRDNAPAVAVAAGLLLLLVYYGASWLSVGRDPPSGTIMPLYGPPDGYSPAAVRYVMGMGYSSDIMAATLVDMAVRGYLRIDQEGGRYVLRRTGKGEDVLTKAQKNVGRALFGGMEEIELEARNHTSIGKAVEALKKSLRADFQALNFRKNSRYVATGAAITVIFFVIASLAASRRAEALFITVWLAGWTAGCWGLVAKVLQTWRDVATSPGGARLPKVFPALFITLFSIPFMAGEAGGLVIYSRATTLSAALLLLPLIAVNLVFLHLMKAPTLHGRRIMDAIAGFRLYLRAAEGDRLNRMHAPERTPLLYEKFLPYAMALGVENDWSRKFVDVLSRAGQGGETYRPSWYGGDLWRGGDTAAFASGLRSSLASTVSSSSRAPGSSSGSGGGGSSGGGGGGGGGGGW